MSVSTELTGYSATVRLQLFVDDVAYELAEIGPSSVYLRQPTDLPPCDADVVMHVDHEEHRWHVRLPLGASSDNPTVAMIAYE